MRVLICDPISSKGLQMLKGSPHQVEEKYELSPHDLLRMIPDYDAVVVRSKTKINREIIEASRLKVIARAGVGLDNIDTASASNRGIRVISTPQAPTIAVAELTIALILCLLREIPRADAALKQAKWIKKDLVGAELHGKVLGVAGFGRIGKEVAKRALAFGAEVSAYDVIDISKSAQEMGVKAAATIDDLLRSSDIVSLHLPLLAETRRLINEEKLGIMKPGSYLVNTSRGGVIDEAALLKALRERKIAGAALDVFETEPPASNELLRLENVVCTPHIGAQTEEAQEASGNELAQQLLLELAKLS